MRQVFSSPRLENVERVAALLNEAGIATRVTHARSYRGGLRGNFSYRDNARTDPVPAVWVVKSEDQPAAREILRNAGLLDSTRIATGYTLPVFRTEAAESVADPARKRAFRLKAGLLLVIGVVIVLAFVSRRSPSTVAPAAPAAMKAVLPAGISPTPDSLARAVLSGELPTRPGERICLGIDGGDPSSALLAALPVPGGTVLPVAQCPAHVQTLAVGNYRRHGVGGRIDLVRSRDGRTLVSHTYDVRPEGTGWRVVEPYR
ncbi:MAG: hypothetical protein ACJ8GK_05695 [Luteimonas sp.]